MSFKLSKAEAQQLFGTIKTRQLEILDEVGSGGFKVVFSVQDVEGNKYALKISDPDKTDLNRLLREAKTMELIKSPYVPKVFDWGLGETSKYPYLLEEFIEGQELQKLLQTGKIYSQNEFLVFFKKLLLGLAAFAEQDIVHRDIKPQNIMVRDNTVGDPVIIDFGISRHLRLTTLTSAGRPGPGLTLPYAAPEMLDIKNYSKDRIDQTTDLFAMGIVAYYMVTGEHPFLKSPRDQHEVIEQMLHNKPIAPDKLVSGLTAEVSRFILKLLRRESFKRFRSVDDALSKLEQLEAKE